MIKKIAHLADIHIYSKIDRHEEYRIQFEKTIQSLKIKKPDLIVIAGDLFHDFINISNEAKVLAGEFLNNLSNIAPVKITMGNHDFRKKSLDRKDSIKTIVELINNPKVEYYNDTNFYEYDENIVFAVWHHSDKFSPWVKYPEHTKDKNKIYIDLFHDPINGCKLFNGQTMEDDDYVKLSDFKGDYVFMGDIHKRAIYYKKDKPYAAYSSSLIQQNGGESIENHGYLLWDVIDGTVEEIDIPNEYGYVNFHIKEGFNYETIKITLPENTPTKSFQLTIHWNDLSSNINKENERNIRKFLKDNYPQINKLIFNKVKKDKNVEIIKKDDERIKNINDIGIQHEIFIEYLKEKGYDDEIISSVIDLDVKITSRLENLISSTNNEWFIERVFIDNFRSYGSDNDIELSDKNGLFHISGENQQGKTNLLWSICYGLYGKTLDTLKKEKNGDNRFINNKRDLDYCKVDLILNINGERYLLQRRTDRKWNKTKTDITSCSTTLNWFEINELNEKVENLNDEQRKDTDKLIQETIGDFDDFLRSSLITSDTINNLLSVDEAKFIDNLLLDSGLDIFDKKLTEYKDYKKETYKKEEKIVLDVNTENEKIQNNENKVIENNVLIVEKTELLNTNKARIEKGLQTKEEEIKKLHKIDQSIASLNIDTVKSEINTFFSQITEKENEIEVLNNKISLLKEKYDKERYEYLNKEIETLKNDINKINLSIKDKEREIESNIHKTHLINGEVEVLKSQISKNQDKIENYETNINLQITSKTTEYESVVKEGKMMIENIDNNIRFVDKEIESLENSKYCQIPNCGKLLTEDVLSEIQGKITLKETEKTSLEDSKKTSPKVIELRERLKNIKNDIETVKSKLQTKEDVIEFQKTIDELTNTIKEKEDSKPLFISKNEGIKKEIELNKSKVLDISNQITQYGEEITKILSDKEEVDLREKLTNNKENIPTQIEYIKLKIETKNNVIKLYEQTQENIKENEKIQSKIDKYQTVIEELINEKKDIENQIYTLNNENQILTKENTYTKERLEKYIKQEKELLIASLYEECIHRDGVPKMLLLKLRERINNEITDILTNVDFTVFFDENMSLKFYNNVKPDSVINVISSSGKERTFSSLVVRLALRNINNRSKSSIMFLDEIMATLTQDSALELMEVINFAKTQIDKIFVIEHAYSDILNPEYILNIEKDETGISNIKFI